jgi:hypothetical protein
MKTVKYFKDLGLEFVGEDSIHEFTNDCKSSHVKLDWQHNHDSLTLLNTIMGGWTIAAFAWRTNTGEKPAFTGDIEVMHRSQNVYTNTDYQKSWSLCNCKSDIIKWRPSLSNKDESTAKNVVDAVNELEADLINSYGGKQIDKDDVYLFYGPSGDYYILDDDRCCDGHWEYVCARGGFNQCIEDMKTNWGTSVTYAEYKSKVSSVMWSLYHEYVERTGSCCAANKFKDDAANIINIENKKENKADYISPVFTQEMSDNDELPDVGMECIFKHGGSDCRGVVTAITKEFIVLTEESGKERIRRLSESPIKPLTPPVVPRDGKAYQFDYQLKDGLTGVYNKREGKFILSESSIYTIYCTNIQPLTVAK